MKKICILLLLILGSYFSIQTLYAQNNSTPDKDTSNQESDDTLTPQQLSEINSEMEPLPGSPGVEVAPPPNRLFTEEKNSTPSNSN